MRNSDPVWKMLPTTIAPAPALRPTSSTLLASIRPPPAPPTSFRISSIRWLPITSSPVAWPRPVTSMPGSPDVSQAASCAPPGFSNGITAIAGRPDAPMAAAVALRPLRR